MRKIIVILLLALLVTLFVVTTATYILQLQYSQQASDKTDIRFGVAFGGNTTADAQLLIDKVKSYTNLFVVQSGPVSVNETSLNEIVNYAVNSNLDVIVYFGSFSPLQAWRVPWLDYAKQHWGSRFLGIYLNDEPGGVTIDANWTGYFKQLKIDNSSQYYIHQLADNLALNRSLPIDNDQAAYHFNLSISAGYGLQNLQVRNITAFTSDYALYWFDYLAGYDTIFTEFGSNQSISQAIALNRGAARLQNKDWGAIITWTYDQPPYLASGTELYSQMLAAYTAGAKYMVIFDYPSIPGNPYGILTEEHFTAMQKFWNTTHSSAQQQVPAGEVALVLPHNYGWGMRRVNDTLWGIWAPDTRAQQIWNISRRLLNQYTLNLDMVYEDERFPYDNLYSKVYFWNETA